LQATGIGDGGATNPLLSSATNLLILFGRLRTGIVEMNALPLMEHVTREIDGYERRAMTAGAPAQEAMVAKYLLCGTADDIVQNLPGADRALWEQYSMAARFFNVRDTGVGFFREAEKAIQSPAQYANLLELMHVCLSLGFEGQYRTVEGGGTLLARIRAAIYEAVRRIHPRPDEDLSKSWTPVLVGGRRRFSSIPVWVIAGVAAAALVAFFATLSTLLSRQGAAVAEALYTLHPTEQRIALNGQVPVTPFVASSTQLDRIRAALAPEIDQNLVSVGELGDYIFVRVGNLLLFNSGQAEVRPEFAPLAARIAEVVNAEQGPVVVEGHTDSLQPSGRGRYKNNLDLSLARAEAVGAVLAPLLTEPDRLRVEGRGEAQPVVGNATEEQRAQNRRVEILIAKEGSFEAP
jgi:type VI secretion system protein ImpK